MPQREKSLFISKTATALHAMQQMDEVGHKLLMVTDGEASFEGLISIGDIQRHLVDGGSLDVSVHRVQRDNVRVCTENDGHAEIREEMLRHRTEFMPVLTEDGELSRIVMWEDIFESSDRRHEPLTGVSGVIMAGGKGTRLRPLTNVIPKPLVPAGDRPILEHIIEWFATYGVTDLFISVGYKADMIRRYVAENVTADVEISYVEEENPMGSIGSLSLMEGRLKDTIVISNCDIIVENKLSDIVKSHKSKGNSMTIVSSIKSYDIPYGVVNVGDDGEFLEMDEKPTKSFWVNTGVYVVDRAVYSLVGPGKMNMDELIAKAHDSDHRIGAFPVSEAAWMDVGQWEEYQRTQKIIN